MVHRGVTCGAMRAGGQPPLLPRAAWGWQLRVGSFRLGVMGNCRGELKRTGRRHAAIRPAEAAAWAVGPEAAWDIARLGHEGAGLSAEPVVGCAPARRSCTPARGQRALVVGDVLVPPHAARQRRFGEANLRHEVMGRCAAGRDPASERCLRSPGQGEPSRQHVPAALPRGWASREQCSEGR